MKHRMIAFLLTLCLLIPAFSFHAAAAEPLSTNDAILIMQKLIGLDVELEQDPTGTNNGYHTSTATEKIIDFCFYDKVFIWKWRSNHNQ